MTTATQPPAHQPPPTIAGLLETGRAEIMAVDRLGADRKRHEEALRRDAWASLTWNAGQILGELDLFTHDLPNSPPARFRLGDLQYEVAIFPPAGSHAWIRVLFEAAGSQWELCRRLDGPVIELMTPGGPESDQQHWQTQPMSSLADAVAAHTEYERWHLCRRVEAARWAREQKKGG